MCTVVILSGAIGLAVVALSKVSPGERPQVLAFAIPSRVIVNEKTELFGALTIAQDTSISWTLRVCNVNRISCHYSGSGSVSESGVWHGLVGSITASQSGLYEVRWQLTMAEVHNTFYRDVVVSGTIEASN